MNRELIVQEGMEFKSGTGSFHYETQDGVPSLLHLKWRGSSGEFFNLYFELGEWERLSAMADRVLAEGLRVSQFMYSTG